MPEGGKKRRRTVAKTGRGKENRHLSIDKSLKFYLIDSDVLEGLTKNGFGPCYF